MEKSTFIGLTMGLAAVGVGMALKGADPHSSFSSEPRRLFSTLFP